MELGFWFIRRLTSKLLPSPETARSARTYAFVAEDRITARIGFPSLIASSRRLIYSADTASPRAYPSAAISKDFDDPSGDSAICILMLMVIPGAIGVHGQHRLLSNMRHVISKDCLLKTLSP
jgi:hypothetical protein